jgi:hypothetical protein
LGPLLEILSGKSSKRRFTQARRNFYETSGASLLPSVYIVKSIIRKLLIAFVGEPKMARTFTGTEQRVQCAKGMAAEVYERGIASS